MAQCRADGLHVGKQAAQDGECDRPLADTDRGKCRDGRLGAQGNRRWRDFPRRIVSGLCKSCRRVAPRPASAHATTFLLYSSSRPRITPPATYTTLTNQNGVDAGHYPIRSHSPHQRHGSSQRRPFPRTEYVFRRRHTLIQMSVSLIVASQLAGHLCPRRQWQRAFHNPTQRRTTKRVTRHNKT